MMYELTTHPSFGNIGAFLEDVEAVNLLLSSSTSSSHNDEEIETFTMGFSCLTSLPSTFEPTPIDPKCVMVVDTFHPISNNMLCTTDDTNFDAIIRGLRTLVETSSKVPAAAAPRTNACNLGRLLMPATRKPPTRDLVTCSKVHPLSPTMRAKIISSTGRSDEVDNSTTCTGDGGSLRNSHGEQWGRRFSELVEYQKQYGNCLVPLNWPPNPSLAHWVKRQRYQYHIKIEGKRSSMTPERLEALQKRAFTWDSHSVAWLEGWQDLAEFKQWYGHPNVPKKYPEHSQLAIWVKCQRRQYKLYAAGKKSNMTPDRIERLNSLSFVFNPRSVNVPCIVRGSKLS